jgi:prevent-host-death family protein
MKQSTYNGKDRHVTDSEWQLQEAKACFSEVVRRSQEKPQLVTVHGKPSAVVVSAEFFNKMLPETGVELIELMTKLDSGDLEFGDRGAAMPVREVVL